ncbi:hypothetical protein MferCBS49748_005882 [Microsporum ferrugineum]
MSRCRRNTVAHGGSVLEDLDILRFLTLNAPELWASGFERLYGMSYDYGKRISRGSKMVALANTRCDLQLLDAFQSDRANISQCDAIIRLWKSAIDTQRDPEGVFELPAVIRIQAHVKNLVTTITQYGLGKKLGIHLLHKHEPLPDGQVKLEMKLESAPGKWIKPILIDSLDLSNIHGITFKVVPEENRLVPYEFGEGPSPVFNSDVVNSNCVKDFISYVTKHDLVDAIALQFLEGEPNECTAEVELERYGTIVLPKSMVNGVEFTPISWYEATLPNKPEGPGPGEHWAKVRGPRRPIESLLIRLRTRNN